MILMTFECGIKSLILVEDEVFKHSTDFINDAESHSTKSMLLHGRCFKINDTCRNWNLFP